MILKSSLLVRSINISETVSNDGLFVYTGNTKFSLFELWTLLFVIHKPEIHSFKRVHRGYHQHTYSADTEEAKALAEVADIAAGDEQSRYFQEVYPLLLFEQRATVDECDQDQCYDQRAFDHIQFEEK